MSVSARATTYPIFSLNKWQGISDSSVVVKIDRVSRIANEQNRTCIWIGFGTVIYSFKGKKKGDNINFNIYAGMKEGMYFHLFLIKTSLNKSFKSSSNSMIDDEEKKHNDECKNIDHPEYTILMEGIGSSEIVNSSNSINFDDFIVRFHGFWIDIPKKIIYKSYGEDWEKISEIKLIDLINYFKAQ